MPRLQNKHSNPHGVITACVGVKASYRGGCRARNGRIETRLEGQRHGAEGREVSDQ